MNEILTFFQEYWGWIAPPTAFAAGQLLNHRRSASLRKELGATNAQLEFTRAHLMDTQQALEKERKLRQKRDAVWDSAGAMLF